MTLSIDESMRRLSGFARHAVEVLRGEDAAAAARRASALALLIRLANAGLAYVAQVVLARFMGKFEYGVFAYSWVWFMVFAAVSTLGFGDSPLRFIPQLRERGEQAYLRGFIRFAILVTLGTSLLAGALIVLGLWAATPWIESAYVLPLALVAVTLPFAGIQSMLEGTGRTYGWTIPSLVPIYILRHGLLLVFMYAAVHLGFAATAVNAFICLVLTLAVSLAYQATTILVRLKRTIEPGPRAYRPLEWLRGSLPFSVLHGSAFLSSFADVLVLSFFMTPAHLAVYFAATRIIQVVNLVPFAAMVGTAHLFSASHTRGDHDELKRLARQATVTTFLIAAAAVAVILMAGDWLLAMFGSGFAEGYQVLAILAVGVMARVSAGPAEDILNMTGNGGLSASTYLAMLAINVPLNIALVIPFGLEGAAIASSAALMLRALYLTYAVRRRLGISISIFSVLPSLARLREALPPWGSAAPAE